MEYLKIQIESKFRRYDKNTRTKMMSEMKEHAEGSYVYLVIYLILADPLMSFCWVVSQLPEVEKCSSRYEIEK